MTYNMFVGKYLAGFIIAVLVLVSLVIPHAVRADVLFRSGDIMTARNATTGQTEWNKVVQAKNFDTIEFRVIVENIGNVESPDVNIRAGFALDSGNNLTNKIYLGVWSAPQATGTVEVDVNDDNPQRLVYVYGKAFKYGGGCDGCSVSDNIAKAPGAYIGKIKPGDKVEVRFSAQVTDTQSNNSGSNTSVTPTPTPIPGTGGAVAKTNPKTGFTDPIWIKTLMWLSLGIGGIGLRQIGKRMSKIEA